MLLSESCASCASLHEMLWVHICNSLWPFLYLHIWKKTFLNNNNNLHPWENSTDCEGVCIVTSLQPNRTRSFTKCVHVFSVPWGFKNDLQLFSFCNISRWTVQYFNSFGAFSHLHKYSKKYYDPVSEYVKIEKLGCKPMIVSGCWILFPEF